MSYKVLGSEKGVLTDNGGPNDRGAWRAPPGPALEAWGSLRTRFDAIVAKHPKIARGTSLNHLGTLGTGNHFIEVCLDEAERVAATAGTSRRSTT